MGRREVKGSSYLFDRWIWDFPEISSDIPNLFAEVGIAKVIQDNGNSVRVSLQLHKPISIVSGQSSEKGITINTSTNTCIGINPEVRIYQLPKNGETAITFVMNLELETYIEYRVITADDLRAKIKDVAVKMTET